MKMVTAVAVGMVMLATTDATAREKEANTPSGRAEMVFGHTSMAGAATLVSSKCMDLGWMVTTQINNQVVCEIPMGVWQSALTQMFVGNSYSTPPKRFVRVSFAQVGPHTRVQTQNWVETQMAFGQVQHHQYTDDDTYNNMLGFLGQAGAQFPVGTSFTSAAYLGVDGKDANWLNGRRSQYGFELTSVVDGAPGMRMGAQVGDVITKVNNRTFRNDEGFTAQLNRLKIGDPTTLTIMRDGQEMTLTGRAEGRPTITAIVDPAKLPAEIMPVVAQMLVAAGQPLPSIEAQEAVIEKAEVVESDIDRMRREAAEAQARLAAAEEAQAKAAAEVAADPAS